MNMIQTRVYIFSDGFEWVVAEVQLGMHLAVFSTREFALKYCQEKKWIVTVTTGN